MATEQEKFFKNLSQFLEQLISKECGYDAAFILLVTQKNTPEGVSHYVANASRKDCIAWMKETIERFEQNEIIPTTMGEA